MADNIQLNVGTGGDSLAADDVGGVKFQRGKLTLGDGGNDNGDVSASNPMPVTDDGLLGLIQQDLDSLDDGLIPQNLLLGKNDRNDPQNPETMALSVSVRDPIQTDPSVPVVTGGIAPSGAAVRSAVGEDGGTMMTDASTFVWNHNGATGPGPVIDTKGYQSIVLELNTSAQYTLHSANTLTAIYATYPPTVIAFGGPSSGWGTAQSSISGLGLPSVWIIPVTGRYFRLNCFGASTASTVTITLRCAPAVMPLYTPGFNLTQIGAASLPIHGGSTASYSMPVGGKDPGSLARHITTDTVGNQMAVGTLPVGYQYGTYNQTLTRYSTVASSQTVAQSTSAPVMMGGTDQAGASHRINTDPFGNLRVAEAVTTQAEQSTNELLYQLLALNRVQAHYLYLIVQAMGVQPLVSAEEPETLLTDFMSSANQMSNQQP